MREKTRKRLAAALLALCMTLGLLPAGSARAAGEVSAAVGSISATVRIDYPQTLQELQRRDVEAELLRDGTSLGKVPLAQPGSSSLSGTAVEVSARDGDGGQLLGSCPGYLDLTWGDLPQGTYTLRLTGEGYTDCEVELTLADSSQHVVTGTGGAFSLGDFDGNGRVNSRDRDALAGALGSAGREDVDRYDLNGDGEIDIVDLSYVNRQMESEDGTEIYSTALITSPVDAGALRTALEEQGVGVAGDVEDLFSTAGGSVTLSPAREGEEIVLPLTLREPEELAALRILCPEAGAPRAGEVLVESESGELFRRPFSTALPEGIHAIGEIEGTAVITIDLGRRVAVKKITITVTETENGYTALESIQFLRDIVPENPVPAYSEVKGLSAVESNEKISLRWNVLPNVSGYRVTYWPEDGRDAARSVEVDVNRAEIGGLTNLRPYQFTVTPVDGTWSGKASAPITATPQPASAPDAPDMVTVSPLDGALSVSWKQSKGAEFYELYYTDVENAAPASFDRFGGALSGTSTTINGLENGRTYYLYVVAGNEMGRSGPSRVYSGTPKAVDYSRPEGLPSQGLLDSSKIESIRLADRNNYDASAYGGDRPFSPENMIDGDFSTHWTANGWTRNEHVVCTFTEPVDLSAVLWAPRMDGQYPSWLRAYSVRVWYDGEEPDSAGHLLVPDPENGGLDNGGTGKDVHTWPNVTNYATASADRFVIMPFGPVKDVVQISVAAEQRDYYLVSCSELMFMEYDESRCLPDNIAALFADELHTQLRTGVTQSEIDGLRERLNGDERKYYLHTAALDDELKLAQELLDGGTTSGVVLRGLDSRSGEPDGAKYGQGGSDLQPLGAAAGAGTEITVYAQGIPAGETVQVYASQYNAEASAWRSGMGTLVNGRNVLTVPKVGSQNTPRGGSLYFTYSGKNPEGISLHVRRAGGIPVLDLSDWYDMDERERADVIGAYVDGLADYVSSIQVTGANQGTEYRNVTEIAMPSVLLSLPASAVLTGLGSGSRADKAGQLTSSVLAWEDLMHICKTTQGIDNTYEKNDMQTRQNIRCMQMFSGAFMYAAGSHIGIGYGSCAGMVGGRPIRDLGPDAGANNLFGWGIAHEIGHNMDKLGRAEITNNIYSLMVQTYDGRQNTLPSRLEKSGKWASVFSKTAQGRPGASNDVFTQLGMYWQLHLAYDEGEYPMWFYNQFFKDWKAGTYFEKGDSYDDKVALTAAGVVKRDLTDFFTRWGMTLSQGAKAKLSEYGARENGRETRAIWYLSDRSRRERLKGTVPAAGTLTAEAAKARSAGGTALSNNEIQITISPSITGAVQGYEIRRNGVPIAFTEEPGYRDVIGSGNHRTYKYTVVAYDILGNEVARADTGEVRVAYDMTVPASEYTLDQADGSTVFTLKQETAVSGIKITPAPDSGAFQVEIKDRDGREVTARTGDFSQGNLAVDDAGAYLTYFNKPGTGSADTRIWTYDAMTVTVTGVPAGAAVELVSYAGDDVALMDQGAVGRLSEDYKYGTAADEVIAKGTLVITGTYRGDPVFGGVQIRGQFTAAGPDGEEKTAVERPMDGYVLLLAEIPKDRQVSDISDGIFIFVPNVQREAELQGEVSGCEAENLLPSRIKAEFYRTDDPKDVKNRHVTAETLWTESPGGSDLPEIVLKGGA